MLIVPKQKPLAWTNHARAKMSFYKLSEGRVRRVLHSPKRIEEGVAPRTVAMMQPASLKFSGGRLGSTNEDKWTQEIWVMFQDLPKQRTIISAWRYPGVTKPRSAISLQAMRREYEEFAAQQKNSQSKAELEKDLAQKSNPNQWQQQVLQKKAWAQRPKKQWPSRPLGGRWPSKPIKPAKRIKIF